MTSPPSSLHRKCLRAANHDYASTGMYVVTICTHHMEHRFGIVQSGAIERTNAGLLGASIWNAIPDRHAGVGLDAWIVMPSRLHGIVVLGTAPDVRYHRWA